MFFDYPEMIEIKASLRQDSLKKQILLTKKIISI